MNLQEAIEHCDNVISNCKNNECSLDHLQLKEWLIELDNYKKQYGKI